jgi:hypothetical protein
LNELQGKAKFSQMGFLDQKLCGILDLNANNGKMNNTKKNSNII